MSLAFLKNSLSIVLVIVIASTCTLKPSPKNLKTVFLASSLINLKKSIENLSPPGLDLDLQFLSSSLIAQQVVQGAPCEAMILLGHEWKEHIEKKQGHAYYNRILATNSLVLASVNPVTNNTMSFTQIISSLGNGRQLIIADPDYVPLGRYSQQALVSLELWDLVKNKILSAHSAYNARVLLEQGAAPFAILFTSDIGFHSALHPIAPLDSSLHKPVNYIFLACRSAKRARDLENLFFSEQFKVELSKHNFGLPDEL